MTASSKRRRLLIITGCVALCVLPVVAIFLISRGSTTSLVVSKPTSPAATNTTDQAPVVVSTSAIVAQASLSASNLAVAQRPVQDLPPAGTYFAKLTDITNSPHFAVVALAANTIIQPDMVASSADTAKAAAVRAPLIQLAPGDVAVSIPFDESRGVGGFVQPGDRLDIAVDITGNGTLRYLFQDVLVLKMGGQSQQGGVASLIVIELNRAKAEEMMFIINGKGTQASLVRYVLRAHGDYGKGDLTTPPLVGPTQPDTPLTPDIFTQLFAR